MTISRRTISAALTALVVGWSSMANAERIADLTSVHGDRINQLQGFGIVTGLQGTGDRGSQYTNQSMQSLVEKYGIRAPEGTNLNSRNSAFVMVQAKLTTFDGVGTDIDVNVSSIGNASSLRGGVLSSTALRGLDGDVYAVAQGPIIIDGVTAEGLDGSSLTVNTTGVGYIPDGATVEKRVDSDFGSDLVLNLNDTNYETNSNIVTKVNKEFGAGTANSINPSTISVRGPKDPTAMVAFVSMVRNLEVEKGESEASVVINSRTGSVVISHNVTLQPVAISEGSLVINISENVETSQPNPLSEGRTVVKSNSQVSVESTRGSFKMLNSSATLQDLVGILNSVGTGASDMVHIMQLLKESGSLNAKIIVI